MTHIDYLCQEKVLDASNISNNYKNKVNVSIKISEEAYEKTLKEDLDRLNKHRSDSFVLNHIKAITCSSDDLNYLRNANLYEQMKMKSKSFKTYNMEELIHIDDLCIRCGFFAANAPINGGYGCNHKECDEGEYVRNGEIIDRHKACAIVAISLTKRNIKCNRRLAKKFMKRARLALDNGEWLCDIRFQGACFAKSCPLGYSAGAEDFIRFGYSPELMDEEWIVVEQNVK